MFFVFRLLFVILHLSLTFIIHNKNAQPRKRSLSPNHLAVRFICKCR
nr:MAG TPA: hypothetical protein [Caudoviricetes sp.]